MKKVFAAFALMMGIVSVASAQTDSTGDLFDGYTRKITYDRMVPPHGLEVTFDKTCHVIFPAAIAYVDLGSANIIAGKADGAENVIRLKAPDADSRARQT